MCIGDSITINLESECIDSYIWFNGNTSPQTTIGEIGSYWVERTIQNSTFRSEFDVLPTPTITDFFLTGKIIVCPSDFPLTLSYNEDSVSYDQVVTQGPGLDNGEITTEGNYWVEYDNNCQVVRDSIIVEVTQDTIRDLFLEDEVVICQSDLPFQLLNYEDLPETYTIFSTSEYVEDGFVSDEGSYWVEYGNTCRLARDSIRIEINRKAYDEIPNIFTPNNDQVNEYFEVGPDLSGSTLEVYSRAGSLLYRSISYQNNWNGRFTFRNLLLSY